MSDVPPYSDFNSKLAVARAGFLDLPSEVRNMIYELLLLQSTPINPWPDVRHDLTTGLFCASQTVHREATSLFYGHNQFDLTDASSETLASFLEQIGSRNAGFIRNIMIDFPDFSHLDPGDIALDEKSISTLNSIQHNCTDVTTLTTSLYSTDAMEHRLENLEHFGVTSEALKLVNTRFNAISSLERIILEVYEDGPYYQARKIMKDYGWELSTITYVEDVDWERGFSDDGFDGVVSDYDDYSDGYDDYDIDNDSDFWRRAGD
jgi:hypothetical protein